MKTKIELILGFLGSGKTNFINSMLENLKDETIVIIQNEFGKTEIKYDCNNNNHTKVIAILNDTKKEINKVYIEDILSKYSPDRIFIEVNSFTNPNLLINLFNNDLYNVSTINNITTLIDAENFDLYVKNMDDIFSSQIINSTKIILSNLQELDIEKCSTILNTIKYLNGKSTILEFTPVEDTYEYYPVRLNFNPLLTIFIILVILGIFSFLMFSNKLKIQFISKFCIIFASIIIRGIPFILIGSFISSLIHFCVSETIFSKIFSKNIFISCITASLGGFFLPIYDCGNIIILKELMNKKVPYGACITFMLSSSIVNPLSIASTLFTFHNIKFLIVYRIFLGIVISIIAGLIMNFIISKDTDIFKKDLSFQYCYCGLFSKSSSSYGNIINLIKAIFIHTSDEFFNMGKLMIIGVFISSAFQTIISINNIHIENTIISLIFMITLSFILSLSSNYDSFIAQSFLNCVSLNSIMGFLICGPMINLKNSLMLLGNFKRKFILKLIFVVMITSFFIILNINIGS